MKPDGNGCAPPRGCGTKIVSLLDKETGEGGVPPEAARKIQQSIAYMMKHLDESIQVAGLAQAAHVSPSHFFVLFKRWTGFSPIDYFIRVRMREACRLLAGSDASVKEIAADLGYEDPFYFSRIFKSVHGVAPTDYRQLMEQSDRRNSRPGKPEIEKEGGSPPLPISEPHECHGGIQGELNEKLSTLHATREVYVLH